MCDIEKILKDFEDDLNSKSQEEKIAYLRSFGFQVQAKPTEHGGAKEVENNKFVRANS